MPKKHTTSHSEQSGSEHRQIWAYILLIIIAASIPFVFSLKGNFVFDDWAVVVGDKAVHSISNIPGAFVHCFGANAPYYRPITSISYIVNNVMSDRNPLGFRIVNLLLHILCSVLVFFFARRILRGNAAPLLAALIFAVHPAHAESVAWISGRTDQLATVFALASILAFFTYDGSGKRSWYIVSLLLFLGALLSKESVIIFPVLIFILAMVRKSRPSIKKSALETMPFLIIAGIFFIARMYILGHAFFGYSSETDLPFARRFLAAPAALLWYFKILLLPLRAEPLHDIYSRIFILQEWHPLTIVCTWVGLIGLLVAAITMRRRFAVLSFGILWVIFTLIPVANVINIPWPVLCERFLYLPSVGFSMIFGLLGGWLASRKRRVLSGIFIWGLLMYCAFQAYAGAALWMTDVALASRMVKVAPNLIASHMFAADAYRNAGNLKQEIKQYEILIASFPATTEKYRAKLIVLYERTKNYKAAVREARILTRIKPKDASAFHVLGISLVKYGDRAGAIDAFMRASELAPNNTEFRFSLARNLAANKDYKNAVKQYRIGLKQNPGDERARFELGLALWFDGQLDAARKELSAVAEHGGMDAERARGALKEMKGKSIL